MGYYLRILAKTTTMPSAAALRHRLDNEGLDVQLQVTAGSEDAWAGLELLHPDGTGIAVIERNDVSPESLGEAELAEFLEEVKQCQPDSAGSWLGAYLPWITVIYALQILSQAGKGRGWEAIRAIQGELWRTAGGVFQADYEGFSNEEGYHILWQFSDKVSGKWQMAVLDERGSWIPFVMDLGNQEHRKAFKVGKVPEGVQLI